MRIAHGQLCFALPEFKALNHTQLCRRLGLGDFWVDEQADEQATQAVEHAEADRFDPARC